MAVPPRLAGKCALDRSSTLFSGEGVTSPMRPWEHARVSFPSPVVGNAAGRRPRAYLRGQLFVLFHMCSTAALPPGAVRGGRLWRPPHLELVRPAGPVVARGSGLAWHHPVVLLLVPDAQRSVCHMTCSRWFATDCCASLQRCPGVWLGLVAHVWLGVLSCYVLYDTRSFVLVMG